MCQIKLSKPINYYILAPLNHDRHNPVPVRVKGRVFPYGGYWFGVSKQDANGNHLYYILTELSTGLEVKRQLKTQKSVEAIMNKSLIENITSALTNEMSAFEFTLYSNTVHNAYTNAGEDNMLERIYGEKTVHDILGRF